MALRAITIIYHSLVVSDTRPNLLQRKGLGTTVFQVLLQWTCFNDIHSVVDEIHIGVTNVRCVYCHGLRPYIKHPLVVIGWVWLPL